MRIYNSEICIILSAIKQIIQKEINDILSMYMYVCLYIHMYNIHVCIYIYIYIHEENNYFSKSFLYTYIMHHQRYYLSSIDLGYVHIFCSNALIFLAFAYVY